GLANLHRALNIPEAAEISALNDLTLRKHLKTVGKTGLEPEQTGQNIRGLLSKQLEEAKEIRGKTTKPLYEKVTNIEKGVPLAN
ncbi:hypothetical protein LAJ55_14865, partial [Streptococcus pneumoniae]|uniref:hypothetical protein n=1 Tax=Streptococcus pneumoniae TaxID=1313 RepID=UPI001CBAA2B2